MRRGATSGAPTPHVLRELSFIADGERGAVLGPSGAVEWLCFPGWADPSVFSTLVGGDGCFEVRPAGRYVWGGHYEEGTLIWRDRWVTSDGSVIECREALALPSSPTRAVLLRRVEVLAGKATVEVTLNPRPGYGKAPMRGWKLHQGGATTASAEGIHVRFSGIRRPGEVPDGHAGRMLVASLELAEGEIHDVVLELATEPFGDDLLDPGRAWEATESQWRTKVPPVDVEAGRRDALHAVAVLQGLTTASGAMMAAATTSLPERADAGRNYDYRYAWVRDMALAGQALAAASPQAEVLDRWVAFLCDRVLEDGPTLSPAYRADGSAVPPERRLQLPGYPGGTDVVGNRVRDQFQLDGLGEVLSLLAAAARLDRLDGRGWEAAGVAADAIGERWQEPDSGFWELEPIWWAQSRLSCVAGLRAMADAGARGESAARWSAQADTLLAETSRRCAHPTGRFQRAPDDERVDASLLLPLVRGALPADDPRVEATLAAVRADLSVDGYVYRYQADGRPLGEAEGAFLLCGFLVSMAELSQGNTVASARWFERTRSACGPPGLFSEEFDVGQRQLRGNLPQAFVHAALLEAAVAQRAEPVT
ncbi:MAG: glycoside hydrolase family 15 protein [Acidobacteriota bacterium]|nr:glycoside hydrolase family 15 protein [Acidobacteriota bacterium]